MNDSNALDNGFSDEDPSVDSTGKVKPKTPRLDRRNLEPQPLTVRIDDIPDDKPSPSWGSGLLSDRASVVLEVQHYGSYLLQIHIDEQAILGRMVPGAYNNPDVDLSEFEAQSNGVSRRHTMLIKEDGMLKVVDLGSTNGTYLNGDRLQPNRPRIMRLGDQLSLGKLVLRLTRIT